jgi:hypothetical protein
LRIKTNYLQQLLHIWLSESTPARKYKTKECSSEENISTGRVAMQQVVRIVTTAFSCFQTIRFLGLNQGQITRVGRINLLGFIECHAGR